MRALSTFVTLLALSGNAFAAADGRIYAQQKPDPDRQQPGFNVDFALTQAVGYIDGFGDESHYYVLLTGADADLSGLAQSQDPSRWVDQQFRSAGRAVVITIYPDGDAQNLDIKIDGKGSLGASGTMGTVYGFARKGDNLGGHYVYVDSLFGNPVAIDVKFDAPLWKAPVGTPLPADGGEAGHAYLALVAAMRSGDKGRIMALQSAAQREQMDDATFTRLLPMMQTMVPDKPKILSAMALGGRTLLQVGGTRAGQPYSARVEMVQEHDTWVMESSSSGDNTKPKPAPAPIAGVTPDFLPALTKSGMVAKGLTLDDAPFAPTHALAIRQPGDPDEPGNSRYFIVLSEVPLKPAGASALWADDVGLEALYDGKNTRSLLLVFEDSAEGELKPVEGYRVSADGEFNKEFAKRGTGLLLGKRVTGTYAANRYDQERGENVLEGGARFDLAVVDGK